MKDIVGNKLKVGDEVWYLTFPEKGVMLKGIVNRIIKYDIGGYKHENIVVDDVLRGPLEVIATKDTKRAEPYLKKFLEKKNG